MAKTFHLASLVKYAKPGLQLIHYACHFKRPMVTKESISSLWWSLGDLRHPHTLKAKKHTVA